ncbi:hypothetical protein K435DRAFT_774972 [Dendrothele bispora CBS 962.96]|uniref:Uncharacterized protein n=1 Tax=Dendrothele bispora (strain CBS 962.96) TaxID=1314807 RepID=A0A4S8MKF7_DENBC|nr:hypothetical protein K435DRAFT_774972 [Dendrothele bispora CBS 962.96]
MVKHLPPSVKQLLTLHNPHPLPSPPVHKLNQVLSKTFLDAKQRNAETGWLVLAACTLLTANRPPSFGQLYRFTTRSNFDSNTRDSTFPDALNKAALIRESALKSTIFVGVPRVILSLAALNEAMDDDVKTALRKTSRRTATPENIESTLVRGRALWDSIYAPHADKLHDKLGSYHPDFISFIIQSYGAVLAPLPGRTKSFSDASSVDDPDQGNFSRALGSIVGIACLRAEDRVVPQLTSHVFGLLKARYVENQSEEDAWLSSDEGTEWVIRTVDEILDGVREETGGQIGARL